MFYHLKVYKPHDGCASCFGNHPRQKNTVGTSFRIYVHAFMRFRIKVESSDLINVHPASRIKEYVIRREKNTSETSVTQRSIAVLFCSTIVRT